MQQNPLSRKMCWVREQGEKKEGVLTSPVLDVWKFIIKKKEKVESPELKKLSDYLKRKHAQIRTTGSEIADLVAQSPNAERTAEIKKLREDKVGLYKQIRRGNDKMDEIAEATIFGTVAEQPPLSSGTGLSRTARS